MILALLLACPPPILGPPVTKDDAPLDTEDTALPTDDTSTDDTATDDTATDDTATDDTATDDTAEDTSDTGTTPGPRGVWAWRDSGDPNGTDAVVGVSASEDAMILKLQSWGVVRVYGSYGDRPKTEPAVIAAWNAKLDAAGIDSQVLMGDPDWISSREWAAMEEKINDRLLDFNAGTSSAAERFDGLHLDIEPQGATDWSSVSDGDRYDRLFLLDATYNHVRSHLDGSGASTMPVYADLPVWFDNLPSTLGGTGSIGWPTTGDRDTWFTDLNINSMTMMAYERDSLSSITGAVADEIALFPGEVRVGLNEEVGTTWADIDEMFDMAEQLETAGYVVDLHSYTEILNQGG